MFSLLLLSSLLKLPISVPQREKNDVIIPFYSKTSAPWSKMFENIFGLFFSWSSRSVKRIFRIIDRDNRTQPWPEFVFYYNVARVLTLSKSL